MSDHILKAMQVDVYHDPQAGMMMMMMMMINVKSAGMIIDREMDMRMIVGAGVAAAIVQDGDIMIIDIDLDDVRIKKKKRSRRMIVDLNDHVKKRPWIKKRIVIVVVVDKVLTHRITKTIVKAIDEGNEMNMKRWIGIDDIIDVMMKRMRTIEEEEEAIDIIDAIMIDPVNVGIEEEEMMGMMVRIAIVAGKDVILLLIMIAVPQDDVWIVPSRSPQHRDNNNNSPPKS